MIKNDIVSFVGKPVFSVLDGMIEDLVHSADIGPGTYNSRQILQRSLQRIVKPRYNKQEHEKGHHIKASSYKQDRTCQCNRSDPQL